MDCIRQVAEVFSLSSQLLSSVFFGVFLFSISISLQIFSVDVFFDVIARRNARQDWKVTFAPSSCNCVSSTSKSFISPSEPSHLVISRRPLKWTIRMWFLMSACSVCIIQAALNSSFDTKLLQVVKVLAFYAKMACGQGQAKKKKKTCLSILTLSFIVP